MISFPPALMPLTWNDRRCYLTTSWQFWEGFNSSEQVGADASRAVLLASQLLGNVAASVPDANSVEAPTALIPPTPDTGSVTIVGGNDYWVIQPGAVHPGWYYDNIIGWWVYIVGGNSYDYFDWIHGGEPWSSTDYYWNDWGAWGEGWIGWGQYGPFGYQSTWDYREFVAPYAGYALDPFQFYYASGWYDAQLPIHHGGWDYNPSAPGWSGWNPWTPYQATGWSANYLPTPFPGGGNGSAQPIDVNGDLTQRETKVASLKSLNTIVSAGLQLAKDLSPVNIDAVTGAAKLAAAAGFAATQIAGTAALAQPEQRAYTYGAGDTRNWKLNSVLELVEIYAGEEGLDKSVKVLIDFLKRPSEFTYQRAPHGATKAQILTHKTQNTSEYKFPYAPRAVDYSFTVQIPDDWTDLQVAQFLMEQVVDDSGVHQAALNFAAGRLDVELWAHLRDAKFRSGLTTVATLAKGYYSAIATLMPGGGAVMAVYNVSEGDYTGAAMEAMFLGPVMKTANLAAGTAASGAAAIAFKVGEKIVAHIPASMLQKAAALPTSARRRLMELLRGAPSGEQALKDVENFLVAEGKIVKQGVKAVINGHHPLPKFLGGFSKQVLSKIRKDVHDEFHTLLRENLKAAGIPLPIGGKTGSQFAWARYMNQNPGSQRKTFDAVLDASRSIDAKYGLDITQDVWKNIYDGSFTVRP